MIVQVGQAGWYLWWKAVGGYKKKMEKKWRKKWGKIDFPSTIGGTIPLSPYKYHPGVRNNLQSNSSVQNLLQEHESHTAHSYQQRYEPKTI